MAKDKSDVAASEWQQKSKTENGRTVTWKERTVTSEDEAGEVTVEKVYPFPKYLGFILGNEFCERYSFYGLRSILVLYLTYFIGFDEDTSTVIYHSFTTLAYFFPLLGAAIADGYLGKYKTILYLSCVYAVGVITQAIGALPMLTPEGQSFRTVSAVFTIVGLLIIAFGTGGIKPCVSSFGGDQFELDDQKNTATFFSLFYWAINAGSVMSTLLSPVLRTMQCGVLGTEDSCYFIAFALPAVLMTVAIGFFLFGKSYYRMVPPSGQNIFWDCIRCIFYGMTRKVPEGAPDTHWLYGAYGLVDDWLIRDTRYLVRVLIMFTPLPVFWAGFDMRGSRWTLECVRMNGYISDGFHLLPDQTQVFNPILILLFIPVFNQSYIWINNCRPGTVTSLRKIGLGMLFASAAYIVSAGVQKMVEVSLTVSPSYDNEMSLRVINMAGHNVSGRFDYALGELDEKLQGEYELQIGRETIRTLQEPPKNEDFPHDKTAEVLLKTNEEPEVYSFNTNNKKHNFNIQQGRLVWTQAIFSDQNSFTFPSWSSKNSDGKSRVVLVNNMEEQVNVKFECLSATCKDQTSDYELNTCSFDDNGDLIVDRDDEDSETENKPFLCVSGEPLDEKDQITLLPGDWRVTVSGEDSTELVSSNFTMGTGAAYTYMMFKTDDGTPHILNTQDINTNDVNMLWIFPQNVVITMAEILISITGMEFAYSQAPQSLKAVLTSFWLMTTAFGDIIVIIVAEGKIMPTQGQEYLLFAGLIFVCAIAFILLAMFKYEYVKEGEFDSFEYPAHMTGVQTELTHDKSNEAFTDEK